VTDSGVRKRTLHIIDTKQTPGQEKKNREERERGERSCGVLWTRKGLQKDLKEWECREKW